MSLSIRPCIRPVIATSPIRDVRDAGRRPQDGPGGGVVLGPPVNTVQPTTTGTFTLGSTLSGTDGTWTGNPAPTFTYQWVRDGVDIGGATASTYVLVAIDMHTTIRRDVIADNGIGAPVRATGTSITAAKILDLSIGTFTRSSEASYPTSADEATIAWASSNVLRSLATRGDETPGALLAATYLLENAATNYCLRSEEHDNAVWVKVNATVAANTATAPDGDVDADTVTGTTAGLLSYVSQAALGTGAAPWCYSVWLRKKGSNASASIVIANGAVAITTLNVTLTSTWQRVRVIGTTTGLGTVYVMPHSNGLAGTLANAGDDVDVWGDQFEWVPGSNPSVACDASSYVRTAGATVTRSADLLTFTDAQIPEAMRTGRFQMAFRADWLASQNTNVRTMGRVEATAFNVWRLNSDEKFAVYEGGVLRFQSNATLGLTARYERHVVVVDLPAGRCYVDGVAQTVGTAFTWTAEAGSWAIGAGAATHWFGRLSDVYAC